jgi:hypothetical protein
VHFKIAGENSLKGQLQKPKHPLSGGEISLQLDRPGILKSTKLVWFCGF